MITKIWLPKYGNVFIFAKKYGRVMKNQYVRVAAAVPNVRVANPEMNAKRMMEMVRKAESEGVQILCFPELSLTGYTCGDLFFNNQLLDESDKWLAWMTEQTLNKNMCVIVGAPVRKGNKLYNMAVVMHGGKIIAEVAKRNLPNYNEFYEQRWFSSGDVCADNCSSIVEWDGARFSIELCEDLWTPMPPSSEDVLRGSDIVFNLSASNELLGKHAYLVDMLKQQSARCIAGYVYASAGYGESSTDLLFAGNGIVCENGTLLETTKRFSREAQMVVADIDVERLRADRMRHTAFKMSAKEDEARMVRIDTKRVENKDLRRKVDAHPFVPKDDAERDKRCSEIFSIQSESLAVRLDNTGIKRMVIGVSGGLDSTLALLVCAKAADFLGLERKNILAVTMPGFGTTGRTYHNAVELIRVLGCELREIRIVDAVNQHFKDIGHDPEKKDVTYENSQARERTQILMDLANETGGLVVGTGDLSELALGWATYNGDQMSMYGVNAGVPKTLVKHLVKWVAMSDFAAGVKDVLLDIVDTPVSPELLPADKDGNIAQKTEDLVGPYELHDFYLYYFLRFGFGADKIEQLAEVAFQGVYSKEVIAKWLGVFMSRFFHQQFKRSAMPDGPKVGSVSLSPRGDWRMPSDADVQAWIG